MAVIIDPEELRRRKALEDRTPIAPVDTPAVGPITGRPGIPQDWIGPGQYYAAGAAGSMTNIPGVNTTMGNVPSQANQPTPPASAIAQAAQRAAAIFAAKTGAPVSPSTPYMTPDQSVQSAAQQTTQELQQASRDKYAQVLMTGQNPHTHEVVAGPDGQPRLQTKSTAQRVQAWEDGRVAEAAQLPGGQRPGIQAENVLSEGFHPDSFFYTQDPKKIPKAARDNYRTLVKPIEDQIRVALAQRSTAFTSLDEVKQFVEGLGLPSSAGEFVDRTMTGILQTNNPALYKQLVMDQRAQKTNTQEYIAHVRQQHPEQANVPDQELAAQFKVDKAAQSEYLNHPDTQPWFYNEATGQMDRRQPRKLTPQEEAARVVEKQSVTTAAERKMQDEEVANSIDPATGKPALTIGFKGGKRQVMSIADAAREEHAQKLEDEAAALKSKGDARAEREQVIKEKVAQAKIEWQRKGGRQVLLKEAQVSKDQDRINQLEKDKALYEPDAWQARKKIANDLAEQHQKELEDLQKQAGPEPDESTVGEPAATPAAAAPVAPSVPTGEPTATGPNGQKVVFRNGQWIPL